MRRFRSSWLVIGLVLAQLVVVAGTALAQGRTVSTAPVVQEWDEDGTAGDGSVIGRTRLIRSDDGLRARVSVHGLRPGGVYTFWWVVVQDDGTFPDDIFVANGAGAVVGDDGRAHVRMSARTGQASITGFAPGGTEITFADLIDPLNATVRIEIAYHGQAADAGGDLSTWLSDFWTGTACPPATPNPNPAQPHCPVYYAATH